jgi:hypothetical protein
MSKKAENYAAMYRSLIEALKLANAETFSRDLTHNIRDVAHSIFCRLTHELKHEMDEDIQRIKAEHHERVEWYRRELDFTPTTQECKNKQTEEQHD